MGILKSIFRGLFSSEEEKPRSRKSGQTAEHSRQRQVEALQKKIEYSGAYIQHLRLDRSWVLPQLVEMGFTSSGVFNRELYLKSVKNLERKKVWSLLLRNYRAIMEHPESERKRWWKKEVAVKVAEFDFAATGNEELRPLVNDIRMASSAAELFTALQKYDKARPRRYDQINEGWPEEFVDAYAGDGAYCAMMTMVRHLGICYKDSYGRMLTREECISEIKREKEFSDGLKMLSFCENKFFTGARAFDCRKYKRGAYNPPAAR